MDSSICEWNPFMADNDPSLDVDSTLKVDPAVASVRSLLDGTHPAAAKTRKPAKKPARRHVPA